MKELGLYIHIPFCASKCKYCSFNSYACKDDLQQEYIKALVKEIEYYKTKFAGREVTTVFIGGGTPSHLVKGGISTILSRVKSYFKLAKNCEITIEANPNSVNYQKALEWRSAGVNRVSIGFQTAKKSLLKKIGRIHTKKDLETAINHLRSVGFQNINVDLMIGLPTQRQKDVKMALNYVTKMGVTHVSAYTLILEEGTPLYDSVQKGEIKVPKEERVLAMYDYLKKYLHKRGFNRYEVSNFAQVGYECKHNLNCWSMQEYVGFGAGAHSYVGKMRYSNLEDPSEYIEHINKNGIAVETMEKLTAKEEFEEYVMLGLRKSKGINLKDLSKLYNVDLRIKKADIISKYLDMDLIKVNKNQLYVTDKGFNVLNRIILDLVYES